MCFSASGRRGVQCACAAEPTHRRVIRLALITDRGRDHRGHGRQSVRRLVVGGMQQQQQHGCGGQASQVRLGRARDDGDVSSVARGAEPGAVLYRPFVVS